MHWILGKHPNRCLSDCSLCITPHSQLPLSYTETPMQSFLETSSHWGLLEDVVTSTNRIFFSVSLSKYFHLSVPNHSTWFSGKANNLFCQWIWFPGRYWCIWEYNLAREGDNLKPQTTLNTPLLTKKKKPNWVREQPGWMINCQSLCSFSPFTPAAILSSWGKNFEVESLWVRMWTATFSP